jgi:lipopolysaccharide heptosyltransferase II
VVFTTPILSGLRRHYPDAHLTYVVEPPAAPVVLNNPHVSELIVSPRRRGVARVIDDLSLGRRLRRERFDVAIDLHGGPRSAWLTWASGAPMRIGYTIEGRTWMYTHPVVRTPEPSIRHSVLNQWDLLAPLGIAGPPEPGPFTVEMPELPAAARQIADRLETMGIGRNDSIVLVHVSASNPFKRWPAQSFVELVVHLVQGHPLRHAVVISGPSEPEAAEQIAAAARGRLGTDASRVTAPQVDLDQLRALIARSAVYIGGDSGPLHVAATTATPIVELVGPTLASRSFPWRSPQLFAEVVDAGPLPCRPCNERACAPGDFRCLTRIAPRQVIEAAERALAGACARPTP